MHVERIGGPADSPLLVFLHHGLGSITQWRDFPAKLCREVGLPGYLIDRPGHGRSEPGPDGELYTLERESERLLSHLAALEAETVIFVGHSDGATIALLAASQESPNSLLGIVSIAAHVFVEDRTRAGIRAAVGDHHRLRDKLRRHHGAKADALFWNWAGKWLSPAFDSWDIRGRLKNIRCPVLALQGTEDEYGTSAQLEAIEQGCAGPVTVALIAGCGHEPHLEAPQETLPRIAAWIRALLARSASTGS
ncbi:MAG: alpha/beta hydrolase [Bryobacteraceae bacterium]|nr:alpha/beta hydrolase [Bryobacteraceae bacterium]MDW8380463.1 alpha/beta hydrolase [Bryobacterales bacterium]